MHVPMFGGWVVLKPFSAVTVDGGGQKSGEGGGMSYNNTSSTFVAFRIVGWLAASHNSTA